MPALLLRFLPHALILAGLLCIGWWLRSSGHEAGEREVQGQWDKQRADQTAVALGTLKEAVERDQVERARMEAERQASASVLVGELAKIRSRLGTINQRIEEAERNDPVCREWSGSPIRCPLPWLQDSAPRRAPSPPGAGPDTVRSGGLLVPGGDPGGGPAVSGDEWRSPPVRGTIARAD